MSIKLTSSQLRRLASVPRPETKRRKRPSDKIPVPPEKEVLRAILALLKDLGIPAWRTNSGLQVIAAKEDCKRSVIRSAPPGTPDIIGWLPRGDGRFLGIEVKRPGERPTPIQIERMRQINQDGGVAFWASNINACHQVFATLTAGVRVEMDEIGNFFMTLA